MVCAPSTSSLTIALVASAALLATQAEALPTHRSTSTIARRAHIASHQNVARAVGAEPSTSLGDHAIVVDASTSSDGANGGIRNSTINLTSISRRVSTLSTFSRVVRSLFGARAIPPAPETFTALPLTVTAPVSAGPSRSKRHVHHSERQRRASFVPRRGAAHTNKKRAHKLNQRRAAAAAAASTLSGEHHHPRNVKRATVVPVAPVELNERDIEYTAAAAQASIYREAVAALGDGEPTASAVIEAAAAAPTAVASLDDTFVGAEIKAVAPGADDLSIDGAELPPVTLTVTLVPSGPNGQYVNAAALATPTASVDASASPSAASPSSSGSATAINPKASTSAAAAPLETVDLADSAPPKFASLAAASAYTPPSAASATALTGGAMARQVRRDVASRAQRAHTKRAAGQGATKWHAVV
ncbi:uncharacterized protein JCM10292_000849 [Rhodotorula paludigena]|uniref:uncharacterized protein n=1 Tax=Rhodotorula paludigena TaxID=86838 RepID=UPI0031813B84